MQKMSVLFLLLIPPAIGTPTRQTQPPEIYTQPFGSIIYYNLGESVTLPCKAEGYPRPDFKWTKNGMDLHHYDSNYEYIEKDQGTILFKDPGGTDEGIYQCIARNDFGTSLSIKINLRMARMEDFEATPPVTHAPRLGEPLVLNCVPPVNYPPVDIRWALRTPRGQLEEIHYNNRITMDLEGRLYITNVQYEDVQGGKAYVCLAFNLFMRRFTVDKENFVSPSGVVSENRPVSYLWSSPSEQVGLRGEILKLKCIFSGNPTPEVYWIRDNVTQSGQELTIPKLSETDAGHYECYGTNPVGPRISRNFVVRVESKPYWEDEPKNVETSPETSATFICKANSSPKPSVAWFINGIRLEESTVPIFQSDRFIKPDAYNITFVQLDQNDSMVLQCNASNVHGYVFADVYLNVFEEEAAINVPPPKELKVAEGQDIVVTCTTRGKPDPIIRWEKDGEPIKGDRYHIQPTGNLLIQNVALSDSGNYSCHAYNKYNFDEASGILIVRSKTRVVQKPDDLNVTAGIDVRFNCSGTTDSKEIKNLKISWLKDNEPIHVLDYRKSQSMEDNSLTISRTRVWDSGTYTCVVSTGLDSATAEATLTVKDKPDQPYDVSLQSCMATVAEIAWSPGASNNAPILYFSLQYNTSFNPNKWYIGATNISATRHTGSVSLSPWTNYNFRVLATNEVGTSEPSNPTIKRCRTPEDVPYKNPENVHTIGNKKYRLVIEWTPMPPIEHNGQHFQYVLTLRRDGQQWGRSIVIYDWSTSRYEEDVYGIFVPYNISVRAQNEVGESLAPVKEIRGFSGEDVPTVSVSNLEVDSVVASTSVTLIWEWDDNLNTPTANTPVSGVLQGFRIHYWVKGKKELTSQEVNVLLSDLTVRNEERRKRANRSYQYTLTGLLEYQDYEAQMMVVNTYYEGPPSPTISFRTEPAIDTSF